jgi:competence protein ComEC
MQIVFMEVGQGDAILITTPNLNQILIDTSPTNTVLRTISQQLNYFDKKVDLVLSTHADLDHVGGLPDVLNKYKVDNHAYNFDVDESSLTKEIDLISDKEKVNKIFLQAGDRIIIDSKNNIYIDILWPTDKIQIDDKNENSIITKIVFNEITFILTGDAGVEVENFLVKEFGKELSSDVLKLGHHGSKTSTAETFLEKVLPQYAVVSAGEDNKFGHPHQEVIDRVLQFVSAENILETKNDPVIFQTDGRDLWVSKI